MKKNILKLALVALFAQASSAFACIGNISDDLLCETREVLFESEEAGVIQEKAQSLGTSVKIYEYLKNNAEYAVYHGARSSSLNTFLGMEGNDVDLASTLISMYRSVGIKSRYVVGDVRVKRSDVANWIGVQNEELAVSIMQNQGINIVDDTDSDYVVFEHVWVEALVNFGNYRGGNAEAQVCTAESDLCKWVSLDPSFKLRNFKPEYRDLLKDLDFDYDAYYRAESDQSLRDKSPLEIYEEQALVYLRENHPGISLEDIIDSGEVIEESLGLLPSSLPYEVVGNVKRFVSIQDHDDTPDSGETWNKNVHVKLIPIVNGAECPSIPIINRTVSIADLSTKRLTLNWMVTEGESNLALRLGGQTIQGFFAGSINLNCNGAVETFNSSSVFNVELALDASPYADPIDVKYENLIAGGYYLIATGGETSNWSQVRRAYQSLLSANEQYPLLENTSGDVYVDGNADGVIDGSDSLLLENQEAQDALTGGLLYTAQALYYTRLKDESRRYSRLKNIVSPIAAFAGIVSTVYEVELVDETPFAVLPGGLLIDLKGIRLNGSWEADQPETYSNKTFKFLGHLASSLEHEIWQELTGYDAISTMRGIQFALGSGSELLDIHNTSEENTFLSALPAFGFTATLPQNYVQHQHNIFGRNIVSWEYTGSETNPTLQLMRGDLSGYDSTDNESLFISYSGDNSIYQTIDLYDNEENTLINLATTENDLFSATQSISGFGGATVVSAEVTSPASGFGVSYASTSNPDIWNFTINETQHHRDGGDFPVTVEYVVDDGLNSINYNISGFSEHTANGYEVVSATVTNPSNMSVSYSRTNNDIWRFTVTETAYHSTPFNLNVSYRLDNGLDSWTRTLGLDESIVVNDVNVTSPSGFTVDSYSSSGGNLNINLRETSAHSTSPVTVNYDVTFDQTQTYNLPASNLSNVTSATITSPSSGFELVSHTANGSDWIFTVRETRQNSAGNYNFDIFVRLSNGASGTLSWSNVPITGPVTQTFSDTRSLWLDGSFSSNGTIDFSNQTLSFSSNVTLGSDNRTLTCNNQSYTGLPSALLGDLQGCFNSISTGEIATLFDALDTNQGFDPAEYFYRNSPIEIDEHDSRTVRDIRSHMYFGSPDVNWNFTIPADLTFGPNYLFNVYIRDAMTTEDGNLVQSSYIIENKSLRLVAGGGYVPEGVPVDPATDTEGVEGSGDDIDTSGAMFNNEVFTDQNLVAIANNDIVKTPSTIDPVSTVTGNMYHDETDFVIPGKGLPYTFTRTYNSNETTTDGPGSVNPNYLPLSQGWTHSYNMKLVSNDYGQYPNYGTDLAPENDNNLTSSITYIDERGGESNYLLDDSNNSAQPTSPRMGFDDLVLNSPSIGLHTITYTNGVKYTFDSQGANMRVPGTVARLYRVEDAYGNQLNFGYTNNRLTSVTDNIGLSGRTGLTLEYYTSGVDNGRLRYVDDWTGRRWEYLYSNGQLQSVINPLGDAMTYTYVEGTHWLQSFTYPQDRNGKQKTMTFSYYENGQAYNYVDQNGSEESLIYDLFRRRTRVTNPRGYITEHYYDENGALIKLVEADKGILLFDNNQDGLRYVKHNALGERTRYSYNTSRALNGVASDTNGQVTREEDALGYTVDYDYGIHGQVTTVKDKNGNRLTNVYYQSTNTETGALEGKLQRRVAESVTVNGVVRSNVTLSEYKYYPDGNLEEQIDYFDPAQPNSKRTTNYVYDYADDGSYTLTETITGSGQTITTEQSYDSLWRLESTTLYRRASSTDATLIPLTTSYTYDDAGRLLTTTDPFENIEETIYDANGLVLQNIMRYRLLGENNSPLKPECYIDEENYPNHHSCILVTNTYDAADHLLTATNIDGAQTSYEYDRMGNITKVVNGIGNSLKYEYDAQGRRTKVTDEKGYTVKTEYDLAGRVIKITDANKNSIRYTYDSLGRQLTVVSQENRITRYDEYDGNGNVIRMTDPNAVLTPELLNSENATIYNEFDEFNRLVSTLNANDEETRYTYDLLGNQTSIVDAENQTTVYVFDDLGRLTSIVDPIIESGEDKVVTISYDELGNRVSYTDRLGEVIEYDYDGLNRIVRERYIADGTFAEKVYDQYGDIVSVSYDGNTYNYTYDAAHRVTSKTDLRSSLSMTWQYDDVGNLISKTNYQGEVHKFTYDSSNRLVAMSIGEPLVIQASYHYDPAGRLLSRILSNGAATLYNYTQDGLLTSMKQIGADGYQLDFREYEHDETGNITKITINNDEVVSFGYDSAYRLTSANSTNNTFDFSYTYDAVGNRLTKTSNGSTQYYVYGGGNRLEEIRSGSLTGPVLYSFDYDANGSMTAKLNGAGQSLLGVNYDQRRLATSMSVNGVADSVSFEYDANAYRIEKQNLSETKKYYLEAEHLESIYDADDELKASFLRGVVVDEVISGFEAGTSGNMENRTFHHDQVNSVVALTDHNGATVQAVSYGPFGELSQTTGSSSNSMKYTGREEDAESGLYYYRARYYDPEIGRFISEDPLGYEGGINLYAYVGNNPLIHNDPTGNAVTPETVWDVANVGLGVYSLQDNLRNGSYGWAALDAIGLAYDGFATAVPILPAGAGYGLQAFRTANSVGNGVVDSVNIGVDVYHAANISHDVTRVSSTTANAATEGSRIHREVGSQLDEGNFLSDSSNNFFWGSNGSHGPQADLSWSDSSGNGLGVWADLTTPGQWQRHVDTYGSTFGEGIPILYQRGQGLVDSPSVPRPLGGAGAALWGAQEAFGDGASGGFLLYPNRINSNMAQTVYSK